MNTKPDLKHSKIAIVGTGSLFPGSITSKMFWENILNERDFITNVPPSHFLAEDYYDPNDKKGEKIYCTKGAFLDGVQFDPVEFGMPPNMLATTDTVQLLSLIVARDVLKDTISFQNGKTDPSKTGVILGVAGGTDLIGQMAAKLENPVWRKSMREHGLPESKIDVICSDIAKSYQTWNENTFPGLLGNVVSGRIANCFDLGGTNCVIDAACASSLGAVKMAIQELQLGTMDMVITGGSDALNNIFMFMCFSKTTALSTSGDCRAFSDKADGTLLGEGIAMVAMKRLEDAERDGDKIYAVIPSIGSSSDGKSKSIYAPASKGQSLAIKRAYELAGHSCDEIELIEAHGTGTKAGDFAEFNGLKMAFEGSDRKQSCAIGSVKSQIGHTKSAAGAASLLKTALALNHKILPPSIKIDKPNPLLDLENSPFYLNTKARPWIHDNNSPRRAGVSSMGFGGTNFHVSVEEYKGNGIVAKRFYKTDKELILFSSDSVDSLEKSVLEFTQTFKDSELEKYARETQSSFNPEAKYRLSFLIENSNDLKQIAEIVINKIKSTEDFSIPNKAYFSSKSPQKEVAFLFSGQGSQYLNMGSDLLMQFDEARRPWDLSANLISNSSEKRLHNIVFPIPVFDDETRNKQNKELIDTRNGQPAIGTLALSHLSLAKKLGITPKSTAGHSYGEIPALYASGVIQSSEDMLKISYKRGELMAGASTEKGTMTAVFSSANKIQNILDSEKINVGIANINSPKQVVISGREADIEIAEKVIKEKGIKLQRLSVSTAFHSDLVSSCSESFHEYLKGFSFSNPKHPVYSNTSGQKYNDGVEDIYKILAWQLANPVHFQDIVRNMFESGVRVFLEMGPGNVLSKLVADILSDEEYISVSMDGGKNQNSKAAFWNAMGRLSVAGIKANFAELWKDFALEKENDRKMSSVTVNLKGSNYGKLYPPKGGAEMLPKPNPEPVEIKNAGNGNGRNKSIENIAVLSEKIQHKVELPSKDTLQINIVNPVVHEVRSHSVNTTGTISINNNQKNMEKRMETSSKRPINNAWFEAFQEIQKSTLEAQKSFQETVAESHKLFLQNSEMAIRQLTSIVSNSPIETKIVQETVKYVPEIRNEVPKSVPVIREEKPVFAETKIEPKVKEKEVIVKVEEPLKKEIAKPVSVPTIDVKKLLLKIVSEKTGYPEDILELDTDLESGLGIDSIKRVEIISALQEDFPQLKDADSSELAIMNTLGEILEYSKKFMPELYASGNSVPILEPVKSVSDPIKITSVQTIDVKKLLLKIVSEKTGYPEDILELDTDLESGLGIDSIKRVEIISALQEDFPQLKDADSSELAIMNTLGEILEYSKKFMPELYASSNPVQASETVKAVSEPTIDVKKLLLKIVAEKTGYPEDILELDTDLESGLGIDSIKRVEIISALQEDFPQLKDADSSELAIMNTLGEILEYSKKFMPELYASSNSVPILEAVKAVSEAIKTTSTSTIDIKKILMKIVAEKTGYPEEILQMDTDFETGLGIDSIKKVEIISAFQESFPELKDIDNFELVKFNTLEQILEYSEKIFLQQNTHNNEKVTAKKKSNINENIFRYAVNKVLTPASGIATPDINSSEILYIVKDNRGIANLLADKLNTLNISVNVVENIDLGCSKVLFLKGLNTLSKSDPVSDAINLNHEAFNVARTLGANLFKNKGLFITVQDSGIDSVNPHGRSWLGGLSALAKTAAIEWENAFAKSIDIQSVEMDEKTLADTIFNELLSGGLENEVFINNSGLRFTYDTSVSDVKDHSRPLKDSDVIVVSGGARGVTASCLMELANRNHLKFAVLGRTALENEPDYLSGYQTDAELKKAILNWNRERGNKITPIELNNQVKNILAQREIKSNIKNITAKGSEVSYYPVDVNNLSELNSVIENVRKNLGPIKGFVHSAGVLADKYIHEKTDEQFNRVFNTKVLGLNNLLKVLKKDALTHICCFSSVAARMGNSGQVDYAMANETLNKVCQSEQLKRKDKCIVKSINWGPWEGGMVSPELKKMFETQGVALIPLEQGAEIFANEMEDSSYNQVETVVGGSLNKWTKVSKDSKEKTVHLWIHQSNSPYMESHKIKGKVVVPLIMVNEWCYRVAKSLYQSKQVVVTEKLNVLKGIQLDNFNGSGDWIKFICTEKINGDTILLDCSIESDDGKKYYKTTLTLADTKTKELRNHLTNLKNLEDWNWDKKTIYNKLFHGEDFQVISDLAGISENGCRAYVSAKNSLFGDKEDWMTDVAIIDGGLQLAILWISKQTGNDFSIPLGLNSLKIYKEAFYNEAILCELKVIKHEGSETVLDIAYINSKNEMVAEISGLRMYIYEPAVNARH